MHINETLLNMLTVLTDKLRAVASLIILTLALSSLVAMLVMSATLAFFG